MLVIGIIVGLHLAVLCSSMFGEYENGHVPSGAYVLIPITGFGFGIITFIFLSVWEWFSQKVEPIHPAVKEYFERK